MDACFKPIHACFKPMDTYFKNDAKKWMKQGTFLAIWIKRFLHSHYYKKKCVRYLSCFLLFILNAEIEIMCPIIGTAQMKVS